MHPEPSPPPEAREYFVGGISLLMLGAIVYAMRDTIAPPVAGLGLLVAFVCAWRRVGVAGTALAVAAILNLAWGAAGIAAILRPLAIGTVAAYLFAPLVHRLEKGVRSRIAAILLVMGGILVLMIGAGLLLIPRMAAEVAALLRQFPAYSDRMKAWYSDLMEWAVQAGLGERMEALRQRTLEDLPSLGQTALEYLGAKLADWITRASALLDLLIVPFVVFYLLKDGSRIGSYLKRLLPPRYRDPLLSLAGQVDGVLGEYARGQVLVCGIVALLTSLGLALCRIPYALLLGCMAGILNIVPYVGLILTLAASCMVALFDPAPASALLRVLAVFAVVQALEGNLITPKIVGERVGLHPLWVMLAVMVFSRIWGIAGMVAAVPVAAVINVLFRASGEAYFRSGFYRGDPS